MAAVGDDGALRRWVNTGNGTGTGTGRKAENTPVGRDGLRNEPAARAGTDPIHRSALASGLSPLSLASSLSPLPPSPSEAQRPARSRQAGETRQAAT